MTHHVLEVRQFITTTWLALSLCLVGVFGWYLIGEYRSLLWRRTAGTSAAIALFIYFSGESLIRIWVLVFLSDGKIHNEPYVWIPLIIGGLCAVTGALCAIRVFAPKYGRVLMIGSGLVAVGVMAAMHYLVN